jgi:hypothetical protein
LNRLSVVFYVKLEEVYCVSLDDRVLVCRSSLLFLAVAAATTAAAAAAHAPSAAALPCCNARSH